MSTEYRSVDASIRVIQSTRLLSTAAVVAANAMTELLLREDAEGRRNAYSIEDYADGWRDHYIRRRQAQEIAAAYRDAKARLDPNNEWNTGPTQGDDQ